MIDKPIMSAKEAVKMISDGSIIMVVALWDVARLKVYRCPE
jgi:hypothetical protein